MLCVIPALRSLRAAHPQARITLLGLPSAGWLLERFPSLNDSLLPSTGYPWIPDAPLEPLRLASFISEHSGHFDLILQMHGSGHSSNPFAALLNAPQTAGFHLPGAWTPAGDSFFPYPAHEQEVRRWTALMANLGYPDEGEELEFPVTEAEARMARQLAGDHPYVCLHPGASEEARRGPAQKFAQVGDLLAERGFGVFITGSPAERELAAGTAGRMNAAATNLAGQTELGVLAALLKGASLLVSNDTGVSHLAAAVRAPSVVIFLASDPLRWAPLNEELHRAVGSVHPRHRNACVHTAELDGHRCLMDGCRSLRVSDSKEWRPPEVGEVAGAALELLGRRQAS